MVRVVRARFPEATEVWLLGEFNNWSTVATPMTCLGGGVWEARLEAAAGPRQICFFVFDAGQRFGRLVRGDPAQDQGHDA
jgi:1,4-alpha-glucan branching enzyme